MQIREFREHDWMGYAGAEAWSFGDPLLAQGRFANGQEYEVVFDATGANLIAGDEHDEYGGWLLTLPFPSQQAACAFARGVGDPASLADFEDLGFRPADS